MDRVQLRQRVGAGDAEYLNAVSQEQLDALTDAILKANRIYVAGFGRAGNIVKVLAMNCSQAGLKTFIVGDNTTPSIKSGDLLIIGSGSGETKTMAVIAKQCKDHGVKLALLSSNADSTIGKLADITVVIPAEGSSGDTVEAYFGTGSFYHTMLMVQDCVLAYLLDAQGLTVQDVYDNHNNLE